MNTETIITVQKGQEYQPRVECIYQESNFFYTSYKRAASGLSEILAAAEQFRKRYESSPVDYWSASSACLNSQLLGYSNNVLAFCADRGQGKTSAMVSFAKTLGNISPKSVAQLDDKERKRFDSFWNDPQVACYHYDAIDYIDPTTMEGNESILKIILSRMFSHFREKADLKQQSQMQYGHTSNGSFTAQRKELLKQFRECFYSLELLKGGRSRDPDEDDLEQIMALGDSSNLRGMLFRLVRCYLEFITGSLNSFLILQIDDADLNIDQAYDMVEDIRKYFVMPNVIVLMAVNMRQMESTVEQYFLKKYDTELKQKDGMVDVETCHDLAERYIDKVLPGARQVDLPELNGLLQEDFRHIQIVYEAVDPRTGEKTSLLSASGKNENWHYQEQLLHLLYQKTGMVFLAPDDGLHQLLPATMRELTHFLNYFCNLPDIEANYSTLVSGNNEGMEAKVRVWLQGIESLEHYLMDIWAPVNLPEEARRLLSLLSREAYAHKHELLLRFLPEYYGHEMENVGFGRGISTKTAESYRLEFIDQCQKSDIFEGEDPCDISYTGVCESLYTLEEQPGNGRQYKFAYAIRLHYSIWMHKLLLSKWPKKDVYRELSDFLGDVFFVPSRVNDPPFGCFSPNGTILAKLLTASNLLANQAVQSTVASLCRWGDRTDRTRKMRPVLTGDSPADFQNQLENHILTFDAFFPVYYALDVLSRAETVNLNEQVWLADSLLILLNWDVQNSLRKCVSQTSGDWLSNWLKNLYEKIQSLFQNVTYTTGPVNLPEQAFLGDSGKDPNGVFFAIQISHSVFFKDYLNDVESLLSSIEDCTSILPVKVPQTSHDGLEGALSTLNTKVGTFSNLVDAFKLSLEYHPEQDGSEMSLENLSQITSYLLRNFPQKYPDNASSFVEQLAELKFYLNAYQKKLNELVLKFTEKQKVEDGTDATASSQSASSEAPGPAVTGEETPAAPVDEPHQETASTGGYATPAAEPDKQEHAENT